MGCELVAGRDGLAGPMMHRAEEAQALIERGFLTQRTADGYCSKP
jgi:hypothetical protein